MARRPKKTRLDLLVVDRGLADSRSKARALIMAGEVLVDDRPVTKAGTNVATDAELRLKSGAPLRYVSRGGLKLETALDAFAPDGLVVEDRVGIDVGASTGGFTDCLLQRGARQIYAVDVGYGQLAWSLRQDTRVVVIERMNIRHCTRDDLVEAAGERSSPLPDLVVADVSFISLEKILEPVRQLVRAPSDWVLLIKPQFEVGKGNVGKGGVVRDPELRTGAIERVLEHTRSLGFEVLGGVDSETPGAKKGNVEYLAWLRWTP